MKHKNPALSTLIVALSLVIGPSAVAQKFEGLALTPPMGWNSWNKFGCNVDEGLIRATADMIVASGMRDAGYQYVIIDDCWHGTRDSLGFIRPDPKRFPSGIKALADYVHAKGLKFGIYSCAGAQTCGGKPGGRGHEYQDALTYAGWGVDYLKYDWCNNAGLSAVGSYTTMRDALFAAGRPIVFSLCEWGDTAPWSWAKDVGHLWRITGDITNCFDCEVNHGAYSSFGAMKLIELRKDIRKYSGPGHWNDPDMLEVGNGMTTGEDRAHFSIWCMLAAPLIAGNDLPSMGKATVDILTNREVIGIDQDSLGVQGFRYNDNHNGLEVWVKPLAHWNWAVCVLNRTTAPKSVELDWTKYVITDDMSHQSLNPVDSVYAVRELWTKKDIGTTKKKFTGEVPAHDVFMFKLTRQ